VDAVGNVICFGYDSLHRMTSTFVSSGSYASSTPYKYFVYDAATVNGVAMANAKTRMAEAYTCTSPCTSKITDLGFSYTVRGEKSDVYESTPHSSGYNHASATYWANGAVSQLGSNIATLPTFNYAPDGEGRINTVSASSGQNPVTGTTYSVASLATQVNFGSSDSDSFTYDPNTNRMTQYKFTVNGQSVVGALTWNAIGTLEDLSVTDPFFSGGNQSCAYTHDDLIRIASANCGSVWSQAFSYDAFGNINKSGTISFQATYSYLTNRMTEIGSSTPTYDANGNVTNDFLNTYAWDASGRPVTADGVGLTYDALGRMVEQNKSSTCYEIVYAPTGAKFAILNGATLQKAFVPLPGGSQAVYTSSGLAYYRHSDWLGSSRFASTSSRTMYSDEAYGPFGEPYAQSGTADLSFTGMNQDTASNMYDFPAREYGTQGRWPSPDPLGIGSAALANPQSWNRYAYVLDNPMRNTDRTGLLCQKGEDCSMAMSGGDYNTVVNVDAVDFSMGASLSLGSATGQFSGSTLQQFATANPELAGVPDMAGALQQIAAQQAAAQQAAAAQNPSGYWFDRNGNQVSPDDPTATEWSATNPPYGSQLSNLQVVATDINGMPLGTAIAVGAAPSLVATGVIMVVDIGGDAWSVGDAVASSPYVQYQVTQFGTSFANTATMGPTMLPSDFTSPGGWAGYAAGFLAWWEQD